jgi:hypothetical protein
VYYGIEYEINLWMNRSRRSDHLLAQQQWENLYRLLKGRLRVDVSLILPRPGAAGHGIYRERGVRVGTQANLEQFTL